MTELADEKPNTSPPLSPLREMSPSAEGHEGVGESKIIGEPVPWIDYAVQQAHLTQKTIEDAVESAISITRSRLDQIHSTSSAHFNQTIVSLQDVKSDYKVYEDMVFGKIKEGIVAAMSHPLLTTGAVVGLGVLGLKRPRSFLYYNTLRLFSSEEALLSRADGKVKELRQSIDLFKAESEKLEKRAVEAEENMRRGRTKLRQAGTQIQSVIRSAYKVERQARGLKDALIDLPSREASRFRTQVSKLASEAKKERNTLTKEITKITNYGISV